MCYFISGMINKDNEVLFGITDSHQNIIDLHKLHVDGAKGANWVPWECIPLCGDISKPLNEWMFRTDLVDVPPWYDAKEAEKAARSAIERSGIVPLYADYEAKHDSLYADYEAKHVPLYADYEAKHASLYADYETKHASLYAEYEAKHASLLADYEAKHAPLYAEYKAKRAPLDAEYKAKRREIAEKKW